MPIDFNDNLQIRAPKPIDDRYGPWETIEEGLINVPYPYRHDKLTLNINGIEYWFKDGLENEDLIIKEYGSGDSSKWETSTILTQNSVNFGRLYNWYAVTDIRGLAPEGWHVPTFEEWITLRDFLGGESVAGGKLKETGFQHWNSPNSGATNEVGFNALGASYLSSRGIFGDRGWEIDKSSYFLTSNIKTDGFVSDIRLYYDSEDIDTIWSSSVRSGLSVRLIKDNSTNEGDVIIDGDTYNAVTIGSQVWLQQNLAVKHYQNGDLIGSDFSGTDGAVTVYNNDEGNVYNNTIEEDPIHIKPKLNKRINANIIDGLPDVSSYPTIEEVQILLNGKEDKNVVITSYYVSTLNELILAWSEARTSSLPTNIYAAGTITLTSNLYLQEHEVHGRHIAIIGVPNATINLNGYTLTSAGAYYENLSFSNPNLSGYLFNENGYINCKNCSFVTDGLDTSYNLRLPIPHITITGLGSGESTGSIVIDGIQHNTNVYEWNRDNLIQPILISITAAGFAKLYVSLKNVTALSSFDRFSRLQIITSGANSIFVTGDTTWFYAPEQLMPGQGFINSDSLILRKSSLSNIKLEGLAVGTPTKMLGIDVNGNLVLVNI